MHQVTTRHVILFAGWASLILAPFVCLQPLIWAGLATVCLGTLLRALQLSIRERFILSAKWFLAMLPTLFIMTRRIPNPKCALSILDTWSVATLLLTVITFATAIAGAIRALVIRLRPA